MKNGYSFLIVVASVALPILAAQWFNDNYRFVGNKIVKENGDRN